MIYLDSAATSLQKPPAVARACSYAISHYASPGRGGHKPAMDAAAAAFACREAAARLFQVPKPEQVVFTNIAARPEDVEDYAAVTVTFSDGTKCLTIASDTVLGGTKNYIEVYSNDSSLMCNITPTDILNTYFLDEEGLDDVYISEMLPAKLGWNKAFVSDEIIRGYMGELQDFMETIAYDKTPSSDFALAYETTKIMYAAYQSAEEGRRIDF